ncbi:hypothetical protein BB559_000532 [Furculomyces boomerangus]|uniref:Complex 1 LYR protein domain-containing protein n=1 Tax=Furculomyces boomerangus TaxID=61424 RepID=A0A2T9Z4S6_9FUNG|nr:hypothetical protein BB559_000532 [Furculomyces boomerangus]
MPVIHPVATQFSKTLVESRVRAIRLYRDWQKAVPEITAEYRLNYPMHVIRQKIRQEFEKNRELTNIGAINIALFKGRATYEETLNCWSQVNHINNYFNEDYRPTQKKAIETNFLSGFLSGQN